ncbi:hypothetical protein M433DRAFT_9756 [Acidomyces richmondensis BFW]|nr:hypothetical protein M433DRAFT_9756 [Acidomyces richmondensis BFW]
MGSLKDRYKDDKSSMWLFGFAWLSHGKPADPPALLAHEFLLFEQRTYQAYGR